MEGREEEGPQRPVRADASFSARDCSGDEHDGGTGDGTGQTVDSGFNVDGDECAFDVNEGIADVALALGLDIWREPHLTWIARRAIFSRLPQPWTLLGAGRPWRFAYFNVLTGERARRHPALDDPVERARLLRQPALSEYYQPTPYDAAAIHLLACDFGIGAGEECLLYLAEQAFYGSLPSPWVASISEEHGRAYYYNDTTRKCFWEHPQAQRYRLAVSRARERLGLVDLDRLLDCSHDSLETPRDSASVPYSPTSSGGDGGGRSSSSSSDTNDSDDDDDYDDDDYDDDDYDDDDEDSDDTDVDENLPYDGIFDPRCERSTPADSLSANSGRSLMGEIGGLVVQTLLRHSEGAHRPPLSIEGQANGADSSAADVPNIPEADDINLTWSAARFFAAASPTSLALGDESASPVQRDELSTAGPSSAAPSARSADGASFSSGGQRSTQSGFNGDSNTVRQSPRSLGSEIRSGSLAGSLALLPPVGHEAQHPVDFADRNCAVAVAERACGFDRSGPFHLIVRLLFGLGQLAASALRTRLYGYSARTRSYVACSPLFGYASSALRYVLHAFVRWAGPIKSL